MLNFISRSIRAKLLVPVSLALVISIMGMAVTIMAIQGKLQKNMGGSVQKVLEQSQHDVNAQLTTVDNDIRDSLSMLAEKTGHELSRATSESLGKEKDNVASSYEDALRESASSVAKLLAKVAPSSILAYDYTALINYSKAVSESNDIVFAFFFDKDNKPLSRYYNKTDPLIKEFIETGEGRKKIDKMLNAAGKDDQVFLLEEPIDLEGSLLGKIVLCVSKVEAMGRIEEMAGRFKLLVDQNREIIASVLTAESGKVKKKLESAIESLETTGAESSKTTSENISQFNQEITRETRNAILIGGFVAILLVFLILFFILRQTLTPLREALAITKKISDGDFSVSIETSAQDEIGSMLMEMDVMVNSLRAKAMLANKIASGDLQVDVQLASDRDVLGKSLKEMADKLNEIISESKAGAEQIATGSTQVASSSQSLSQGATESAASLEQITSSMTEMASQTTTNAENASQANQLSGQARDAAEKGNSQMQNMVAAMDEINDAGKNISKIIKVIDEIAFQTNLLALNAAVEAARAGRHGKGFAVVAEEVRNLAARSAKAANETSELIEGSVEKTNKGSEIAGETAEALAEIVSAVTKVTDLVGEIAAASNEQAEGIAQVNQGLTQIDQVTQQNTASAEEGAAAAEELSSQAVHLTGLMSQFKVKGNVMPAVQQNALPGPQPVTPAPQEQEWGGA